MTVSTSGAAGDIHPVGRGGRLRCHGPGHQRGHPVTVTASPAADAAAGTAVAHPVGKLHGSGDRPPATRAGHAAHRRHLLRRLRTLARLGQQYPWASRSARIALELSGALASERSHASTNSAT